jgi:hypothetical protein
MRFLTLATGFWVSAATAVQAKPCPSPVLCVLGAPAPSIGAGLPVALAAGAVLCGMMLLRFWRRS